MLHQPIVLKPDIQNDGISRGLICNYLKDSGIAFIDVGMGLKKDNGMMNISGQCRTTLSPSIGNWNFRCRSHYWIRQNRVEWVGSMTERQIRLVQDRDRCDIESFTKQPNLR